MSAFECYKEYVALKNHFTKPSYDYFKYNGKAKLNPSSFDGRKDKLFFQKLAKHPDVHNFLVANLSENGFCSPFFFKYFVEIPKSIQYNLLLL